ncbi:MAG: hypothetical protein AB9834_14130 [Lentimicrobium sp.]
MEYWINGNWTLDIGNLKLILVWNNGIMEEWKDGKMERWKDGKMEWWELVD